MNTEERDENEAAMKAWRRRCGDAEAERDRLQERVAKLEGGIGAHREAALERQAELVSEQHNHQLWSLLDPEVQP